MTIKVYVNHDKEEVITEKEFLQRIVPEEIKDVRCSDTFNDWLTYENNFTYAEVFYLTREEKEKTEREYEEYLREKAIINLENDGWGWVELEV